MFVAAEIKQTIESLFDLPDIVAVGGDNGFHHLCVLRHGDCSQPSHLFGNGNHGLDERVVVVHVILSDAVFHQPFQPEELSKGIGRERPVYWRAF